jgi:hypothetical protein
MWLEVFGQTPVIPDGFIERAAVRIRRTPLP